MSRKEAEIPAWISEAAQEIKDDLRLIAEINFGPIGKRHDSKQFMPLGIREDVVRDGIMTETIWVSFMRSGRVRKLRVAYGYSEEGRQYIKSVRVIPGEVSDIEYLNYLQTITHILFEANLKPIPGKE